MAHLTNEEQLVRAIRRRFPESGKGLLRLALGDDAALFRPRSGYETILTCDWFLEGSHFLRDKHPADAVGWKCLARAVSDVAAMGGEPRCFLLSLALPKSAGGKWLREFLSGLRRVSKALGCELAGGDTTRREEILINVTVVGEIRSGRAVRRAGARPGDQLFVTGTLGEAELGLRMMRKQRGMAGVKNPALRKHLYPEPRLAVGQWLAEKGQASAMMDLSDGLSTDLGRMCTASRVGARIDARKLPVSALAKGAEAVELALHGGDDYELLFAVRPEKAAKIPEQHGAVRLTRIGEITAGRKILVEDKSGERRLVAGGWDPFRSGRRGKERKG
jgi:thiamine-monophosphate kinase